MRASDRNNEWNDHAIAELRRLWGEGVPAAQIGDRIGFSKNAVIGKAHRLHLPPRESPIKRGAAVMLSFGVRKWLSQNQWLVVAVELRSCRLE